MTMPITRCFTCNRVKYCRNRQCRECIGKKIFICKHCDGVFQNVRKARYCSLKCRNKARNLKYKLAGIKKCLSFTLNLGEGMYHELQVSYTERINDGVFFKPRRNTK